MLNIAQYVCGPKKRTMGYNGLKVRWAKWRTLLGTLYTDQSEWWIEIKQKIQNLVKKCSKINKNKKDLEELHLKNQLAELAPLTPNPLELKIYSRVKKTLSISKTTAEMASFQGESHFGEHST